jgi:hypothetical protein
MSPIQLVRLADSPVTALSNAVIQKDEQGLPHIDPAVIAVARQLSEEANTYPYNTEIANISACLKFDMMYHYFHFMEIVIVLYSYVNEYTPNAKLDKIFVGTVTWSSMHEAIIAAIFPEVKIVILFDSAAVDNLIYIDANYVKSPINKFIDPVLALALKWGRHLKRTVYQALEIDRDDWNAKQVRLNDGVRPRCMYPIRSAPRCFSGNDDRKILDFLSDRSDVIKAEFSNTPWPEQVKQAADCDLMVGIHGNGLTNLLWLPPHAHVIEIFPADTHHYDYQVMCEVMGLSYFGLAGKNIFREYSRFGPAYGHGDEINKTVSLPSEELLSLIFWQMNAREA